MVLAEELTCLVKIHNGHSTRDRYPTAVETCWGPDFNPLAHPSATIQGMGEERMRQIAILVNEFPAYPR